MPSNAPTRVRPGRDELVIGLVKAIGTNANPFIERLRAAFESKRWDVVVISVFESACELRPVGYETPVDPDYRPDTYKFAYWREHRSGMATGDVARQRAKTEDIVVRDALKAIQEKRDPERSQVFILKSLMHPSEVNLLKDVYGKRYFTIAVYEPRKDRLTTLLRNLLDDNPGGSTKKKALAAAEDLLTQDSNARGRTLSVQKTFHRADVFVDASRDNATKKATRRFVEYLFGYPYSVPTADELAMSIAFQSRYASSALSRTVGAAAFDPATGSLLTASSNGTPRSPLVGPWPDDDVDKDGHDSDPDGDYREHLVGVDTSDVMRWRVFVDMIDRLKDTGTVPKDTRPEDLYQKSSVNTALHFDSISYGSTIHAEASLIARAAASRTSLAGATLYVTTYPCHECTRLIIESGIQRVVYIEPYPKSLAIELYGIQVHDPDSSGGLRSEDQIEFEPFVGIGPSRFTDFFSSEARKEVDLPRAPKQLTGKRAPYPPRNGPVMRSSIFPELSSTTAAMNAVTLLENEALHQADECWESYVRERQSRGH